MTIEAELRVIHFLAKECEQHLEAGKRKETDSSKSLQQEMCPADILILDLWDPFWTSDLQIAKIK